MTSTPPGGPSASAGQASRSTPVSARPRRFSGFVEYVLDNSQNEPELESWFAKPKKEGAEAIIASGPGNYAEVPDELRRRALLKKAESYYLEDSTYQRASTWLVLIFTYLIIIPAFFVFISSRVWHHFFPSRLDVQDAAQPQAASGGASESKGVSPSTPSPRDSTGASSTPIGSKRAYEFKNPWTYARSWALWIVYIPMTRYQGTGGLKGALLPSQSPKFLNDQAAAVKKGKALEENAKRELERTRKLYKRAVTQRRLALEEAERLLDGIPDPRGDHADYNVALHRYESLQKTALRLKVAVDNAETEWEWVREVAKTETCAAATSYRGIADWASDAHGSYSNLMNAISGVCFVGAGLTYSSIFGATRGNIGLMCWAFSLFIVGLSILITVQSLLMWCSRLENYPFSTPKLWEFFLGVGVYGACAAVITAIALLVVTVLNLHFNVDTTPYQNPNASPWDAHLVFNVSPRYAAVVAFSFIGAGIIVAVLVFVLFSMANTVKLLLWRRSIERSRKHRVKLDDLV